MRGIKSRLAVLEAYAARRPRIHNDFAERACRRAVLSNATADILTDRWPEILRVATEQELADPGRYDDKDLGERIATDSALRAAMRHAVEVQSAREFGDRDG